MGRKRFELRKASISDIILSLQKVCLQKLCLQNLGKLLNQIHKSLTFIIVGPRLYAVWISRVHRHLDSEVWGCSNEAKLLRKNVIRYPTRPNHDRKSVFVGPTTWSITFLNVRRRFVLYFVKLQVQQPLTLHVGSTVRKLEPIFNIFQSLHTGHLGTFLHRPVSVERNHKNIAIF